MVCEHCECENVKKHGKDRQGAQRYRCRECGKTFSDAAPRPLGSMRIEMDKAVFALKLLLEGMSVRATERMSGLHRDTLCDLILTVGEQCEEFLDRTMRGVEVRDVQCDEVWGFVGCKEKTRQRLGHGPETGDAYCFVAIERNTKLVVCWHLGKRTSEDTWEFVDTLRHATSGRFQISTDGFRPYSAAVPMVFAFNVDFAQLIKRFGGSTDTEPHRRYSPAQIVSVDTTIGCGTPDPEQICTSHVERSNLTMRMTLRRMTRLTNGHSKSWKHHRAMLALYFAWYNFVRKHATLRSTPAEGQGLTNHAWTIEELLRRAAET